MLLRIRSWRSEGNGLVDVRYTPQDADIAPAVAEYAARAYETVSGELGYASPRELTVLLFPSFADLEAFLPGIGPGRTIGVTWDGVVGVVSPASWGGMFGEEKGMDAFYRFNPLYHEITHFVLEESLPGGWPVWFSEGLAQLEEYRVTGYVWDEAVSGVPVDTAAKRLALGVIGDAFLDPALINAAYGKSLWAMERLEAEAGAGILQRLVPLLKGGREFEEALQSVSGLTYSEIDRQWLACGWPGPASGQDRGSGPWNKPYEE